MRRIIIGAGMSGLTAAILSAANGDETVVLEQNIRAAKKVSATGNGRCNIGNTNVSPDFYNRSATVKRILSEVSVSEYERFLNSIGIYVYADGAGRLYPVTESAADVADCLRFAAEKAGAQFVYGCTVQAAEKSDSVIKVSSSCGEYVADDVVLAVGGAADKPSLSKLVPSGYFTPSLPSLCALAVKNFDKNLSGQRVSTTVSLNSGNHTLYSEKGELQFKDGGLSGICIFNCSAYIARDKVIGLSREYSVCADLAENFSACELSNILKNRIIAKRELSAMFYGILPRKIGQSVLKKLNLNTLTEKDADKIAYNLKNTAFTVDTNVLPACGQVTAGGISEEFVSETLLLPCGIRAVGEILNADGLCGGYNLFFAAASAMCLFDGDTRKKLIGNMKL